ncbi:SLC13 family permease [Actinokineospora globicatena]|uniref:SLC13 family permease n=1 Tax=Actinokineospora globicatena TaxID=103729 RepID=UPI0020A5DBAB|nr:SLC13 family permease [Actinokineospora globicatena]MCP2304552.1 arsenical pump membrane protein [Actinokineospora globicatena]GLW78079.1 arsenic transporter [Actinokineospora globicatena]GLW85255.1 arsenic transporter [Actinokineospora globicatena]
MPDKRLDGATRGLPKLHVLDWVALGLLLAGCLCVAFGALPAADARATVTRLVPLLLFLGSVIILAELTAVAEVFDVVATRLSILGRGRYPLLFLLCVALAAVTTMGLNLDTTAVLLTPVLLALAAKLGVAALPLAMTTVWLANTASLLLPVSNLTNLLAADRVALAPAEFAAKMWAPQLAAIVVTAAFLWVFYWRGTESRPGYAVPERHQPTDGVLFRVAAVACALFVIGILVGVPIGIASSVAAGILVITFVLRRRSALTPALLPWRLLVFVIGLFLVVETINRHGLADLVHAMMGDSDDAAGAARAAGTGALLSNLVNNLPAYVAGESVVPLENHNQLLALLVGTNVGPIVTPWASLATLLWYERCIANGIRVPMTRFLWTSAGLAITALTATVATLLLVG